MSFESELRFSGVVKTTLLALERLSVPWAGVEGASEEVSASRFGDSVFASIFLTGSGA